MLSSKQSSCAGNFEIYLSPKYIQGFAAAQTVCNVHKSQAKCHFVCLIKAAWEFLGKHSRIAPLLLNATQNNLLEGVIFPFLHQLAKLQSTCK